MKIESFSFKKLIADLAIVGSFVYSKLYLSDDIANVYIWWFWIASILTSLSLLVKPIYFFTEYRSKQSIISEFTISVVLVYFGYPVLATVGFISGLFYAISRRQSE